MKIHKFRGLTIEGSLWVYGLLAHAKMKNVCPTGKVGWYISNKSGEPFAHMVRPETIGMYTGESDSLGKEIYEDDAIVIGRTQGVVEYYKSMYVVKLENGQVYCDLSWGCAGQPTKVIGNKHEPMEGW